MEGKTFENQLKALSLNYLEAPIEVRELFSFEEERSKSLLIHLQDVLGIQEGMVLSTCNRTEIYFNHSVTCSQVMKTLASFCGITHDLVSGHFQYFEDSEDAIRHLFRVAIGLESQILGDLQIINQVKNAYQWCADLNMAGTFLHRLLHTIFFANKRVVQETNLRVGSASVSYATTELVDDLVVNKATPITIFGLGEMGLPILKNLLDGGFSDITICNRTFEKVEPFCKEFGVKYLPFSQWRTGLSASLIISTISGKHLQIAESDFPSNNRFGFHYLLDLGVPRSISPEIDQKEGVILYNIDQIHSKISQALEIRKQAVGAVEAIIEQAQNEFSEWTREMSVSPVIHLMKNSLEQIRKEELARFLKRAGEKEGVWADELTKNLMQRIMKTHIVQLKAACKRDEAEQLTMVLEQLFHPDGVASSNS